MSAPDPSEWTGIAPHPGARDLPPGRHELHRDRLLAAIAQETRTPGVARTWRRPALAAALVLVAGVGAGLAATAGDDPPAALPAPVASRPAARPAPPGGTAKIQGYGTVRHLTATADLVVRGEAQSAADGRVVYRVAEVLYRASHAPVSAKITVLAPEATGRATVLYLALSDPLTPAYTPLGGDVGIFDVTGDTVTSRSATRSVTGLRAEDATTAGRAFVTTLPELRQVAAERG
ncbi:hypothetical protein [Micromonospora sp. WMMD710]|uniref:hypothetical protein n=1 Tax=Micromonospora sp. WMMD710 TaxID=3016085 RepID=UPI002416802D|nr:hypothetical protein [Micromonospora sp. WMMD710]MDG4757434.1 hypothetical protein [Micromonospora sp. WMMD710]